MAEEPGKLLSGRSARLSPMSYRVLGRVSVTFATYLNMLHRTQQPDL